MRKCWMLAIIWGCFATTLNAQIVINEGCNKNFASAQDEDGESPDWIELYNAGNSAVDLYGYALSDDPAEPMKWVLPHIELEAGEYKTIFCSGKDRYETPPAVTVVNTGAFVPVTGLNTHEFTTPFYWDGLSNIVINTCSYSSLGYITNSVFNNTFTDFNSCTFAYADGSPAACGYTTGGVSNMRPNMFLNGVQIGTGTDQNCNTCYPAPYGNWYWGARNQMLIRASELTAAGLTEGLITSLGFDVVWTDPVNYDYIEVTMNLTNAEEMSASFINESGYNYHTNFGISAEGETIFLYNPQQEEVSQLYINAAFEDVSVGSYPDAAELTVLFANPSPGESNNGSEPAASYADAPLFSASSGVYTSTFSVEIENPNGAGSSVHYTTDGSLPTIFSPVYNGTPIFIYQSTVLRARAFTSNQVPSEITVATYLMNVSHATPILSVVTDNTNLYGASGIFDNFNNDWMKPAYIEYFDSIPGHPFLFGQRSGMIQDGGYGGSRWQPQHSFRLELANGALGDGPIEYPINPNRAEREYYTDFYLRNGSNQYNVLPYKDAAQVRMMAGETNGYYSSWRPISVYINGQYFGLYELREKFNTDKFIFEDNATDSTIEILSLSAFYGFILRAVEGDENNYINDLASFNALDPASPSYLEEADQYFDLKYYADYIIGETWMGNVDWPGNNIKIYRSDATDYRWRFCTIDLELALLPNGWTDCYSDNVGYVISQGEGHPFVGPWNRVMNSSIPYRNYYINRFADLMNTSYESDHLIDIENAYFNRVVVEMPNQFQRWGDPWNVAGWMNAFVDNHLTFQAQLACRSEQVRNHLVNNYGLNGQQVITLDVFPEGAGRIQINTVTPGEMPWSGIYFDGVPVNITAIPNPGYIFDHWISDVIMPNPNEQPSITFNLSTNDTFTAHFQGIPMPTDIVVTEFSYNDHPSHASGDWIEIHNNGNAMVDLTGWRITNEDNTPSYYFADGTVLYANEYVVLVRDPAAFQAAYPGVEDILGPLPFTLSGDGGGIRIYNHYNELQSEINYLDIYPWPATADGQGRTVERGSLMADENDAASWFAGCMFGSPGEAYTPCDNGVVISEINYASASSANAGDWIELRNVGDTPVDISAWKFRGNNDLISFEIPSSTILESGEMLVLCSDQNAFDNVYPEVSNRIGDFDFGLDQDSELIRLYESDDKIYFSMIYYAANGWPETVNGTGYTLELADSSADFSNGSNWFDGCLLGSPGVHFVPCDTVISVAETLEGNEWTIYPNPGDDLLFITSASAIAGPVEMTIYDASGRMIRSERPIWQGQTGSFTMTDLSSGIYTLVVRNGMHAERFKWVKR